MTCASPARPTSSEAGSRSVNSGDGLAFSTKTTSWYRASATSLPNRAKGNGAPPNKWIEGAVVAVHGLTFDSEGALYAMEWNKFGRVTKYVAAQE